ncbi:prolactin releasing hormone 2 [Gadus chalcogrammus]|uniref:prolactin releasing hormone 2 n=1 Tax=Gadus chalcogrammus TaxID=1042646 RepID=UPI0024C49870|nr:prolactin releasing hormone 2 [Gadus chalcogrammus]
MLLTRLCLLSYRWLAVALAILLASSTVTLAHSTTVEHDFHIVHNVDNRSPEIDPFWYVGRGVRPIGRFGKRHSGLVSLAGRSLEPVLSSLELLLNTLRNKDDPGKSRMEQGRDWLP